MLGRRMSVVTSMVFALAVVTSPAIAASTSPFAGTWTSTDTDGSSQMLIVSGGPSPSVIYQDFYASGCDNGGAPTTHWTAAGQGSIEDDVLFVSFHKSGCGPFGKGGYGDFYIYDGASDTLVDQFDITWSRA